MSADTGPERYDAAVIGAGAGGLAVAARLVAAGGRVYVLERRKEVWAGPGGARPCRCVREQRREGDGNPAQSSLLPPRVPRSSRPHAAHVDRPWAEGGPAAAPRVRRGGELEPGRDGRGLVRATPALAALQSADGRHLSELYGIVLNESNWRAEVKATVADLENRLPAFDRAKHVLRVNGYCGAWPRWRRGDDVPQRTPGEKLYDVGDGVMPFTWSGLPTCPENGRIVAGDILDRRSGRA